MSELSKQALKVDNNTSFPNNNGGLITPAILRDFNTNIIDSLVDEIGYNVDSASWNQQIDSLEQFTASVAGLDTGSLLITASATNNVITFTKGDASTFNVTVNTGSGGDISALNQATASLQQFTASAEISISNLNASSASQQVSINNLNTTTASLNTSSSLALVTASFDNGTRNLTFTKGDTQTFSVNIPDVSGSAGNFVSTSSFNSYTQSTDSSISQLNASTASQQISIDALNLNSASVNTSVTNLNSATSSLFTSASLGLTTASISGQTLTFSKGDGTTFGILIPDVSGSTIDTGSFATTGSNTFTGDQTLIDGSGNFVTLTDASSSLMLVPKGFTSSSLHLTASAAAVGNFILKTNNSTADTTISGNSNIFVNPGAPTAGFKRFIGTSNIYTQQASTPQVSGSMNYPLNMIGNIVSNANNAITFRGPVSSSIATMNQNILMGGTINLGTSAVANFEKAVSGHSILGNALFNGNLNMVASTTTLVNSVNVSGNLLFGSNVTLNHISSSLSYNSNVQNGGFTVNNRYSPIVGTVVAALSPRSNTNTIYGTGHVLNIDGSNVSTTQTKQHNFNLYAGTFLTSSIGDGDSCGILATAIVGNALIVTGSTLPGVATAADVASVGQGSMFIGRFNAQDGNKSKTAETVFAVGTGTGYGSRKTGFLIDSGSNTIIEGSLNVSGAVSFTGSAPSILSSSFSGSLITNLTDIYTDVPAVQQIVTLSSASYAGLVSGSLIDPNTLYVVSGSTSGGETIPAGTISSSAQITALGFVSSSVTASSLVTASVNLNTITFTKGDSSTFALTVDTGSGGGGGVTFPYSGSVEITGSVKVKPFTLSVTSQTASINMNESNYFILNLPTSSTTHIAFTNIIPGESINLLVSQSATVATGSIAFAPNIYFPNGSDYQATTTGSARDIVSFITFNTNEIYATQIKNLY
jgi:hypothetical protein